MKRIWFLISLIILVSLFILYQILPKSGAQVGDNSDIYYGDAETICPTKDDVRPEEIHGLMRYGKGTKRTSEQAHSGNSSLIIDSIYQFGFALTLTDVKPGELFIMEVWCRAVKNNSNCHLVAASPGNVFYYSDSTTVKYSKGWKLIRSSVRVPEDYIEKKLSFYVWNGEKEPIYIDDFQVVRLNYSVNPDEFELEKLQVYIEDSALNHLSILRDKAIKKGILKRGKRDYVKTKVVYRSNTKYGKIRLKGDWADHLLDKKWSFRIKLDAPLIDGIKTFSIQNPFTRGCLNEYIYHKILERENILTPEYRFVHVYLNDVSWGVYALEEHLSSRIFERQSKPNGVILKFDEKPYWEYWEEILKDNDSINTINLISKADIKIYGKAKKDKRFQEENEEAKSILQGYRKQDSAVYNFFDMPQMAKYYALCDVTRAYHAMVWNNIRFYYNFQNKTMEPVGYDAYGRTHTPWANPYLGFKPNHEKYAKYDTEAIVYDVFRNPEMEEYYYKSMLSG